MGVLWTLAGGRLRRRWIGGQPSQPIRYRFTVRLLIATAKVQNLLHVRDDQQSSCFHVGGVNLAPGYGVLFLVLIFQYVYLVLKQFIGQI
jgi:hypothetical protein